MALVVTDNKHYTDIANAIRSVNGESSKYKPGQMSNAILALSGAGGDMAFRSGTVTPTSGKITVNTDLSSIKCITLSRSGTNTNGVILKYIAYPNFMVSSNTYRGANYYYQYYGTNANNYITLDGGSITLSGLESQCSFSGTYSYEIVGFI